MHVDLYGSLAARSSVDRPTASSLFFGTEVEKSVRIRQIA